MRFSTVCYLFQGWKLTLNRNSKSEEHKIMAVMQKIKFNVMSGIDLNYLKQEQMRIPKDLQ